MLRRLLKALLVLVTESIGAVLLVLVFFLASLAILSLSFPRGTSLQDLVRGSGWTGTDLASPLLEMDLGKNPDAGKPHYVARLTDVYRKVKDKRADWIAWGDSRSGTQLETRHAIQTYAGSGATITFDDHSQATLGENSLLVIRGVDADAERGVPPRSADVDGGHPPASLIITDGQMRGTVGGPDSQGFEVVTGAGSTRIAAGNAKTDFKVKVNSDKSSTFSVYDGKAEVTAEGHTVELRTNQTVTVDPGLPPGDPGLLPAIPVPTAPPSGTVVPYRTVPPRIRLAWGAAVRADAYRLEIAREPRFHDLVDVEDALRANQFVHGNLASGVYYWRVSALAGHADGKPCPPQRLELVQDREAPALRVDFPEGPVEKGSLVLRGQAEPGAQVFIGNERISTDDSGRFEVPLNLEPGINIVVVEAMDAAGNATYRSGLLDAKDERVP